MSDSILLHKIKLLPGNLRNYPEVGDWHYLLNQSPLPSPQAISVALWILHKDDMKSASLSTEAQNYISVCNKILQEKPLFGI